MLNFTTIAKKNVLTNQVKHLKKWFCLTHKFLYKNNSVMKHDALFSKKFNIYVYQAPTAYCVLICNFIDCWQPGIE